MDHIVLHQDLQAESIGGLMDIPGIELNVQQLLRHALQGRQVKLRKKVNGFAAQLDGFARYLDSYPYRRMISRRDTAARDAFASLLTASRREADSMPPPSPQAGIEIVERLTREAAKLGIHRMRLELLKRLLVATECSAKMLGVFSTVAVATALFISNAVAQSFDVVILNGRVMDPETGFDQVANIGINNGWITTITSEAIEGAETIDATGHVVAPGFIDLEQHGLGPWPWGKAPG